MKQNDLVPFDETAEHLVLELCMLINIKPEDCLINVIRHICEEVNDLAPPKRTEFMEVLCYLCKHFNEFTVEGKNHILKKREPKVEGFVIPGNFHRKYKVFVETLEDLFERIMNVYDGTNRLYRFKFICHSQQSDDVKRFYVEAYPMQGTALTK